MKYRIQKDVPIPPRGRRGKGTPSNRGIYPWEEMEVGDSFFAPAAGEVRVLLDNVAQASNLYRRRAGVDWKFALRSVKVGEIKGVRCWRIK